LWQDRTYRDDQPQAEVRDRARPGEDRDIVPPDDELFDAGEAEALAVDQPDLCFALALWTRLRKMDEDPLSDRFGVNCRNYFRNACRYLDDYPDLIARLRIGKIAP
jgi:hypothetical protein